MRERARPTETPPRLPASISCPPPASKQRVGDYEARGVFPAGLIDSWASRLIALGDEHLREDLADSRLSVEELVERYFHIG